MKIKSLQISNILSFAYVDEIENAPKITFDKNLNILIGQNGSGKSTALEVINFIFKRVFFIPYTRELDSRINTSPNKLRPAIENPDSYNEFRLDCNYDFEEKEQKIRAIIELDNIDKENINLLIKNENEIKKYTNEQIFNDKKFQNEYQINITLYSKNKTYKVETSKDLGYSYLKNYNLYKEIIEIYNKDTPDTPINNLAESFVLIGGYRNYNSYIPNISLDQGNTAEKRIQEIQSREYSRSVSSIENSEPFVFSLVRLKMASKCFDLLGTKKDLQECQTSANDLDFIKHINEKLKIVNLKVEINLTDYSKWSFKFSFVDTKRNKTISDLNSLSAGQKAITHLIFEAYGRGNLKGGLIIIDEPEIHLHYQFQNEYMRVIESLNNEQDCQYLLVTHSESLINSKTINSIVRFSLDENRYTKINQPTITTVEKWLIKILENKKSTHAFFGSKVLLVEGDSDRYFFRAILEKIEEKLKKGLIQDITVLNIDGKDNIIEWEKLFNACGLQTFFIGDLDCAFKFCYPKETKHKFDTPDKVKLFLDNHNDILSNIEKEYENKRYILKQGYLEMYINIKKDVKKDVNNVINFCKENLNTYLEEKTNTKVQELKKIMSYITGENEDDLW
jgi:predicted ATP-dependent endonuclease of OLD family